MRCDVGQSMGNAMAMESLNYRGVQCSSSSSDDSDTSDSDSSNHSGSSDPSSAGGTDDSDSDTSELGGNDMSEYQQVLLTDAMAQILAPQQPLPGPVVNALRYGLRFAVVNHFPDQECYDKFRFLPDDLRTSI